ncbi:MAG: endonuclease/exonuclease/phosphatase family protein [Gemmatimonadetes bacterium]|nr:endonuclease/exonuclease/phosphatase family protein [Gemmatimonadota bacterium]
MSAARTIIAVLCVVAGFAAILSLIPVEAWPVELAASFRVQIAVITTLAAGLALGLRARVPATIAGAAALACWASVVPLALPASQPGAAGPSAGAIPSFRILTINLEWSNRNASAVLGALREAEPDILVLQEVDNWWREQFTGLSDIFPVQRFDPLSRRPGVAILLGRRIELRDEAWLPLHGRPYADFVLAVARDASAGQAGATMAPSFRLTALHALPPRSALLFRARTRQLDDVRAHLLARDGAEPQLVVGDFNMTIWSPSFRRFTRELHLERARLGFGLVPTWPTWNSLLQVPIDHILHSPGFVATSTRSITIPGSDHHGLLSDVLFIGRAPGDEPAPAKDS